MSEVNSGVHNLSTKRINRRKNTIRTTRKKKASKKCEQLPDETTEGSGEVISHAAVEALRSNVCVDESRGITITLTSLSHLGCEAGLRARACWETIYVGGLFINTAGLGFPKRHLRLLARLPLGSSLSYQYDT